MIEVQIHRAYLVVEGKRVKLTKSIAKQFPVLNATARWDAAVMGEPQPEPLCKVAGKVLGEELYAWMYLVPDEEAGLGWIAAMQPSEGMVQRILERGGWVDDPSRVPTVIL